MEYNYVESLGVIIMLRVLILLIIIIVLYWIHQCLEFFKIKLIMTVRFICVKSFHQISKPNHYKNVAKNHISRYARRLQAIIDNGTLIVA